MSRGKKPATFHFRTIEELHTIPLEKVEHFCRDLALWLMICKVEEVSAGVKLKSPRDVFGWIDDGKHNVNLSINVTTEPTCGATEATTEQSGSDRRER